MTWTLSVALFFLGYEALMDLTLTMIPFNCRLREVSHLLRCFRAAVMQSVFVLEFHKLYPLNQCAGGQAFMIKLRKTPEGSPSSMVIEPPHSLTGNMKIIEDQGVRWRHLK